MSFSKTPTFRKHQLTGSPIYELAVRIVALTKNCSEVFASGTGVVISQNLILTAKHVFKDFIDKWKLTEQNEQLLIENFNIWVIFISNDLKALYHVYEVASVYINPYSDQVLFHLDSRDRTGNTKSWLQPRMSLTIPKVGERVVSFGFTKSNTNVSFGKDGKADIEINDEPFVSVGEIIDVFPEKRDLIRLPFPSIQINARLDGGMSGGPVFNDSGHLLGIVCSSFNQESDDEHISFVSLLWPLMATPMVNKDGSIYPLYDLAKKEIITVDTLANIILTKTDNPSLFNISYKD